MDIATLMVVYMLVDLIGAGATATLIVQNRRRYAGIPFWLAGMLMQAAGSMLIVLRGNLPDFLSIVAGNVLTIGGELVILIGLERFTWKKGPQWHNYVILAAFAGLMYYNSIIQPDLFMRQLYVCTGIFIFSLQCAWLMLKRVDPIMRGAALGTGMVFAAFALVNAARFAFVALTHPQNQDFLRSGPIDSVAILLYIVLGTALTISLVLMVSRRLNDDMRSQEDKYTTVFHSSPSALLLLSLPGGKIIEVNDSLTMISGYRPADVLNRSPLELELWASEEERLAVVSTLLEGREINGMECRFVKKSGETLTGIFHARVMEAVNDKYVLASISDITDRKQAEEELARSEERYRRILEEMHDVYMEEDLAGNFTFVNSAACSNLGYSREELVGQNFRLITLDDAEAKLVFNAYNRVFLTGQPRTDFAFRIRRKDGSAGYAETSITLLRDKHGRPTGFRSFGRNVTDRKLFEQKLLEMATHDPLTGLPNRNLLYDRFNIALAGARRSRKGLAILALDLDHFKDINDTHGHDFGDRLLKAAAERLVSSLRASDTVARMGGDEFILLLGEIEGPADAVRVAEKIVTDFRQPFSINGRPVEVTASIGLATYPGSGESIEQLLKEADNALYSAKQAGRNCYILQTASL